MRGHHFRYFGYGIVHLRQINFGEFWMAKKAEDASGMNRITFRTPSEGPARNFCTTFRTGLVLPFISDSMAGEV
jgi:hypothetical protein